MSLLELSKHYFFIALTLCINECVNTSITHHYYCWYCRWTTSRGWL